jgi:phage shock protein A
LIDTAAPRLYKKLAIAANHTSDERTGAEMIMGKFWAALRAQVNKLANFFWTADPIAQMQYEYDMAVAQLSEGRKGLEQYRALVERVTIQVKNDQRHVTDLEAKTKAYLQAGDRETAAKFALEMQKAKTELAENQAQLKMHEDSYNNNVTKIKHASGKLSKIREKIAKYDAELKMSKAEAEIAQLAQSFNFDVTTDFGQIEQVIQDKISLNRAKVRVAADLSSEGLVDVQREQAAEKVLADQALKQFEVDMGLVTPETAGVKDEAKELGAVKQAQVQG